MGFVSNGELFITGRLKDVMIIRGQNHYPQDIEMTVQNSHLGLRPNCGAAFMVGVKGKERLVIVQEVKRTHLRKLNVNEVVGNIRQAVTAEHSLQVYATVLIRTGSIPKTSSGKIQRRGCRTAFVNNNLNMLAEWSLDPGQKAEFRHLQTEVNSLIEKMQSK